MAETSSEALMEELAKAHGEARQVKADLKEDTKRVSALNLQYAELSMDERIRMLEDQVEDLTEKLKRAEVGSTYSLTPSSPDLESPKTQSDDEYIVVEQEGPNDLENKLKLKEAEMRKAIAHAKRLEDMYNTAERKTLTFERQVKVLEANMFEKFDDANALLEKVKELEELLTAGQIQQIAALEEKSKSNDEAQKKVEYEKVLFLETEDQLVKNFKKAHDEAEQYRNTIFQLENSVKDAQEKIVQLEKCMEPASRKNQELESVIADLNSQLKRTSEEISFYSSHKVQSDSERVDLDKALNMYRNKADSLEQELQMYRGREKKVEDDLRSVEEKTVVHEASSSPLHEVLVGNSMDGHASSVDLDLAMSHGRSNSIEDELKFLGENVIAHVTQSKLLMKEFTELQSAHILYACESEVSKSQLQEHVKDLEAKVSQLEQEISSLRGNEDMMKQEVKALEDSASFFEGLKLSYADYTCNLEKKSAILEEELNSVRGELAAHVSEQQKWTLDCDRLRGVESRNALLEAQTIDLQAKLETPRVCELCLALKTQIKNLEVMLGELSLELQELNGREQNSQKDVESLEKNNVIHEQFASKLEEEASSLAADHNIRVQSMEAQINQLQEENLKAKASIAEQRLWAEEAASVMIEHAESLHGLREECLDMEQRVPTATILGHEDRQALQARVEGLHLALRGVQLCDGSEALQMCKELLSLERKCLNFQVLDVAYRNTSLKSELEVLKSKTKDLQNPQDKPAIEPKKSFREVFLEGEVQSLRAQVIELHSLRAQASELPYLQARLEKQQLSLRAAETREYEQNLELVEVQRKVAAAEEKICSLQSSLLNQKPTTELRDKINSLQNTVMKLEAENASLKEIDVLEKLKAELEVKVTDEIMLEDTSDSQQPPGASQKSKLKSRKKKSGKSGRSSPEEILQTAHKTHSPRYRIAIYLFSVILVATIIRFSLR
nr:myosin-10-like isoform X3 [Physcomitrium patens]|eukprot:XP_024362645.1 myosin-10-like isoform X3 [Physcomitrella patens]